MGLVSTGFIRAIYVVLPMTITVAISYGIRKFLCKESVYTLKLARPPVPNFKVAGIRDKISN